MPRGSQHGAAKRRREKERQAKQAAKRERRFHKGEGSGPAQDNDALVREYLGLPPLPEQPDASQDTAAEGASAASQDPQQSSSEGDESATD